MYQACTGMAAGKEIRFSLKCAASWAPRSAIHAISREKASQGESVGSNSLKSDSGRSSETTLEKVALFAGVQLRVGPRGSQYAAGDKRVLRGFPLTNEHIQTHQTSRLTFWPKNPPAERLRVNDRDYRLSKRCFVTLLSYCQVRFIRISRLRFPKFTRETPPNPGR